MSSRLRVGIIFGGPSREREVSFAGGRTVYDNLDKRLFEPLALFMDANRRLINLDWEFIYKGTIRDFWPPVNYYPEEAQHYQLSEESLGELTEDTFLAMASEVGRPLDYAELPSMVDFIFLALHGVGGEDGSIQGTLETYGIPYTGSGIAGSAVGMDKVLQKRLMAAGGFHVPLSITIDRTEWDQADATFVKTTYENAIAQLGTPLVVRGANQGSSIGVSILNEPSALQLERAINLAFFKSKIDVGEFKCLSQEAQRSKISSIADLRHGIGFPMLANGTKISRPDQLERLLTTTDEKTVFLQGLHSESKVVIEGFLSGTEVSTIVLRNEDGGEIALLPTEIVKGGEVFDYRSKYLPGLSRKKTPADLPQELLEEVRSETERLFRFFDFDTYARIDGFVSPTGQISLNDPNTTSGMLPSSFFFHQAAEIGLSPGEFLTLIIRTSLRERAKRCTTPNAYRKTADSIDDQLKALKNIPDNRRKIAVLLGGYSSERHISVESGRNIYEKLASSGSYAPTPVFVKGDQNAHTLHQLPINLLLKDNADDIKAAIEKEITTNPVTAKVRRLAHSITEHFSGANLGFEAREITYDSLAQQFDEVFIALHGRPGEDGEIQRKLDKLGLAYNGSTYESSQITIDKYKTLGKLRAAGFTVTDQRLITRESFASNQLSVVKQLTEEIGFPMIVKPVDDGCSSAVQKINDEKQLQSFLDLLLGISPQQGPQYRADLGIHPKDEIPLKKVALVEKLIAQKDADLFLEITGGLLTTKDSNGEVNYNIFEPSEALSSGEILTLEEKFLAGEGQNITPARFAFDDVPYQEVAKAVKATFESAAKLLNVEGYARIDAFVRAWKDGRVETIIIEVNSLPGMTPATCIYHQAALEELTPFQFIDAIMKFGRSK